MELGLKKRFLLVSIIPQRMTDDELLADLEELKLLVDACNGEVQALLVQRREMHDPGMYIGRGKASEAAETIKDKKIDVVVLNAIVKATQLYDMKKIFYDANPAIEVWDRVDLILQIFSRHARTAESRLQIELAAMRHMGPRIYGMGMVMSRQGGGIGGRGVGETNTELMRRHWNDQIKKTQEKLSKLAHERMRQMERRREVGLETISIIGYTNAGKTSLFNLLSHKKKLVENQLFATLDSSVGKLYLPDMKKEVLFSDTIGFIQKLPAKLIDAFKSTLMESIHADLLLHIVDVSDKEFGRKIEVVEDILMDLGIFDKKRIMVFNKLDAVNDINKEFLINEYKEYSPQFISVKKNEGIVELIKAVEENF